MQVKEAIIWLKTKINLSYQTDRKNARNGQINNCVCSWKQIDALSSLATPNDLKNYRKQLKQMLRKTEKKGGGVRKFHT